VKSESVLNQKMHR